ncbi:DEAD/DEAH box helicase [Rhizobium leguminosarum]|uniref:DEAD/DEAH box helicase n=1 Tax=Rhizobium TaxID=379 RepID=UPI001C924353|nr:MULTISPECIES: DEAD/DEAH box helicase [Rhizobium]MBY3359297.1 DEAD/DEAH box helicase [Rhizobium laguerreae]MBY5539246.1 DEAD/DEAH box helicase [Rhizobium leguminosarum]
MDNRLRHLMAELESWESAVEFGIPQDLWAEYQVRLRSDDLYIASFSEIFDALRNMNEEERKADLTELAKTLLIYTRSAAARYLSGVEANTNLLYASALFYLAGYPATATLAAKGIDANHLLVDEEQFLLGLLSRRIDGATPSHAVLAVLLRGGTQTEYNRVFADLARSERAGLADNPTLYVASRLAIKCLERFQAYSTWNALSEHARPFNSATWQPFIENSATFPLWELFPSQLTAVSKGILGEANDVVSLQMPTSAGKTSLCELLIFHEVKARAQKVLFLVPFRALAAEIKEGLSKRLEEAGVSVLASYGGNIPTRSESASVETADVLIVTPEKFTALAQAMPELENRFGTVVCDEGHLIDDEGRGLQYELLLTKLKGAPGDRKIVFISAILPNVPDIHKWLGGDEDKLAKSTYRPVEIDFAFIEKKGSTWQLDFNTIFERPKRYFLARFLTDEDFAFINPATRRRNLFKGRGNYLTLASAAALKARQNGPVALFTTTKGEQGVAGLVEVLVKMVADGVGVARGAGQINDKQKLLADYVKFQLGDAHQLTRAMHLGIAFHHGSLPQEIRREIEDGVHSGLIDILVCTSTLAEGVNLPIRTLVMHTIKRFDGTSTKPISRRSIKNIVGRVGRAGKETRGRIIFANESEKPWVESVFREQNLEPAKGALFNLVNELNDVVVRNRLTLDNELFERQDISFLAILDRIDMAIIDLMPADFIIDDIENHIGSSLQHTLAYRYFDTDELRDRINEIFLIRARALIAGATPEGLIRLRKSGSTPRFQRFIDQTPILDRIEWLNLSDPFDPEWLNHVALPLLTAPTLSQSDDIEWIRALILLWMMGSTYAEIAILTGRPVDDCLEALISTVGFTLQDNLAKTTQLALLKFGEEAISETASKWNSMLQYGLGNLRQLDMFELGASDRLAVWSLSRFLDENAPGLRGREIVTFLRSIREAVVDHLRSDGRVPVLSADRTIRELRLV